MKTGEASAILGIDRSTLHNWINDRGLEKFFSPSATGADGNAHRTLTEADVLVLNTIRTCRGQNLTWEDILQRLNSGHREQEFPLNAISADRRTIPLQQAEQSARAMATLAERDSAMVQVNELRAEIERLEDRLAQEIAEKEVMKERLLREMGEVRENLLRELGDLQRKSGNAERLEQDLSERNGQISVLTKEVGELNRQIGKLEGQLEFYRENKRE
jgi:DNA-binding transcriptional MerR regulator